MPIYTAYMYDVEQKRILSQDLQEQLMSHDDYESAQQEQAATHTNEIEIPSLAKIIPLLCPSVMARTKQLQEDCNTSTQINTLKCNQHPFAGKRLTRRTTSL